MVQLNHFFAIDKSFVESLTFQKGFDFLKTDGLLKALAVVISGFRVSSLGLVITEFPFIVEDILSSSSL